MPTKPIGSRFGKKAVKDSEAKISLHVAVRSANERLFAERKATHICRLSSGKMLNGVPLRGAWRQHGLDLGSTCVDQRAP